MNINSHGCFQGDHLSGKPRNVRQFDSFREMSGILLKVGGKHLVRKSGLKLCIISCIFVSIQVFGASAAMI